MKFKLRGKTWSLTTCWRMKKMWGTCCYETRSIKISKDAEGIIKLDTILHESLHAAFPDLNEETVESVSSDLALLLWELGYKGTK